MSNSHLNMSKAMAIVEELRKIPSTIDAYNRERTNMALETIEDYSRLVIGSPIAKQAICKEFALKDCRARFAFPTKDEEYPYPHQAPYLEIYDVDGKLIGQPHNVYNLSAEVSLAVHLELYDVLLISKGVKINQY